MICPFDGRFCHEPDCKDFGCLEQRDDDGEETPETLRKKD